MDFEFSWLIKIHLHKDKMKLVSSTGPKANKKRRHKYTTININNFLTRQFSPNITEPIIIKIGRYHLVYVIIHLLLS